MMPLLTILLVTTSYATEPSDLEAEVDKFIGLTAPAEPTVVTSSPNALNPRLTAFGDLLWSMSHDGQTLNTASTPWLRSLELDIRADVDPYAKAVAVIGIHQEDPLSTESSHEHGAMFSAAPEEVYIDLVALPYGFTGRVGQFLLPLGLTNRMHPHDYPWAQAPMSFQMVMGEHPLSDVGFQLSHRVASPFNSALSLDAFVSSGQHLDPDAETAAPLLGGRVELFQTISSMDFAFGGSAATLHHDWQGVADTMIRWRQGPQRSVVLLGELFHRSVEDEHHEEEEHTTATDSDEHDEHETGDLHHTGWTSTLQVQPTRHWYIGVRYDRVQDTGWTGGTVSYYTSEFLRLRASVLTHDEDIRMDTQLTFVWGSHPVEPYWVNR